MSMSGLQSVSKEIRESFKAGEEVVFGAHVDENLGEEVKITVLGATSLDPIVPQADVAPVAQQVIELGTNTKQSHRSKLSKQKTIAQVSNSSNKRNGLKKQTNIDQNTFSFMEEKNQRGIFDDLPKRNMYEGEDLDVPAYLRRGVKIAI